MTNIEAIMTNVSGAHGVVLTENHFVKTLLDVGLSPTGTYTNKNQIDRATVACYDLIIGGANLKEGDLSYSIDVDALRKIRDSFAEKLGEKTKNDEVRGISIW